MTRETDRRAQAVERARASSRLEGSDVNEAGQASALWEQRNGKSR
jgi:hypothetical protein